MARTCDVCGGTENVRRIYRLDIFYIDIPIPFRPFYKDICFTPSPIGGPPWPCDIDPMKLLLEDCESLQSCDSGENVAEW